MVQLQMVFDKVTSALRDIGSNSPSQQIVDVPLLTGMVQAMEESFSLQKEDMGELREAYHDITERISAILEKVPSGGVMDSAGALLDEATDAESTDLVKSLAAGTRRQVID